MPCQSLPPPCRMAISMKHFIIPVFIPHLGCPHACVFCNQASITAVDRAMSPLIRGADVLAIARKHLATLPEGERVVELSFFGGTFTGIPIALQEELLSAAETLLEEGSVSHIRCSTRPDFIDEAVLKRCQSYGMDIMELGVQSLDDGVLRQSGRGHDRLAVERASRLIKDHGIRLGHQIMPGLPGANRESDIATARASIAMAPDEVRIYPTLVVEDTPLAELFRSGAFQPLTLDNAVELTQEIMGHYEEAGIKIIRVGLQATEEISPNGSLLAGPYHPAFKELVLSFRLNEKIRKALTASREPLELVIHPKDLSVLYADKKRYFRQHQESLAGVLQDEGVQRGSILLRRKKGDLFNVLCI